MLKANTPN
jgi:cleavage and polyadenylation specificity factor subunit 3